jgi:hypothetical protein
MKFNLRLTGHVHVRMKTDRQTKEMEKWREKKERRLHLILRLQE